MKKIVTYMIILWITLLCIPLFGILGNDTPQGRAVANDAQTVSGQTQDVAPTYVDDVVIKVMFHESGEVREMQLHEYLYGVLTAEMPASYDLEALKAQAVAARSYTYNKYLEVEASPSVIPEHDGAHVCTDYTHCKAYLSLPDVKEKWGDSWEGEYYAKIQAAVNETDGEILSYNDEPVSAVFHSASYGKTENAKDVWGNDVAYLQSVETSDDITSDKLNSIVVFSIDEFKAVMLENYPDIDFSDDPKSWVQNQVLSEGGSTITIDLCGQTIKGTLVRTMFDLRATNFDIKADDENVTFTVRGYGHGVGMSQTGANEMAQDGSTYDEILQWYYQGTNITYWGDVT